MTSNILVLGAGELGTAVLSALASKASPTTNLTVLLRPSTIASTSPYKQASLAYLKSLNIAVLPGDIASSSTPDLAALFRPYNTIISCLGFASGPGTQLKIAHAVLQAGVKRFLPWEFGVDYDTIGRGSAQDLFDEKLDVRDLLRGQTDTEWVIISTGMFTSFLFESYLGVVDLDADEGKGVARALGAWENKVTVTTAEDIGKLTAEVVLAKERVTNEVVFVAGDTVSYEEVADAVDGLLKRTVRREVWTVDQLKAKLKEDPDNAICKYRVVFAEGKGCSWNKAGTFNAKKGIEVVDLRRWILEHLRKD
jgi:hypothetical protein